MNKRRILDRCRTVRTRGLVPLVGIGVVVAIVIGAPVSVAETEQSGGAAVAADATTGDGASTDTSPPATDSQTADGSDSTATPAAAPTPAETPQPSEAAQPASTPSDATGSGSTSPAAPKQQKKATPTPTPSPSEPTAPPDASQDAVAPLAVDAATITVTAGGNRTGDQSVAGLAGVAFDIYTGRQNDATVSGTPIASCTTTAPTGTCSVDVPAASGGGNNPNGYWVVLSSAPAGWYANQQLDVGGSTQNYRFFTGNIANNTNTMIPPVSTGNSNAQASGGIWQVSKANPGVPGQCGLDIAVLVDLSNSVSPFIDDLRNAGNGFVDALTGTPSRMAVYTFAGGAPAYGTSNQPLTSLADTSSANTLKDYFNDLDAVNTGDWRQGTNWDSGLWQIAPSASSYDVVLVLTDGNPTYYGPNHEGPGGSTRFREVENAVFSANAIKSAGTKVIAVGIGSGVSGSVRNLQSISGHTNGDDYFTTSFDQLGTKLQDLADEACNGTVTVVKKVIAPGGSADTATTAGGWTFTTPSTGVSPTSGTTGAGTGATNFAVSFPGGTSRSVTFTETTQPGFTLAPQGGKNAVCTAAGQPLTVTNDGVTGFAVTASPSQTVTCTVYNQAPNPTATVKVDKAWVIDGTPYTNANKPSAFNAQLQLTGQTNPSFGTTYSGYHQGDQVTIDETYTVPPGCQVTKAGTGTKTLAGGANSFTITNTVTCVSTLTLIKHVSNQYGTPADPSSWTLLATQNGAGSPTLSGATGTAAVTKVAVNPEVPYILQESGGPAGYAQEKVPGYSPNPSFVPQPTGSWHCSITGGAEYDGLNGAVTVQRGQDVVCVANNSAQPAKLTLVKAVDGSAAGATADPTLWSLTAQAAGSPTPALSGASGSAGVTGVQITPGTAYTLAEAGGPAGFPQTGLACVLTGTQTPVTVLSNAVTAGIGQDVTCTFTNTATPPQLTLIKSVTNTSGGTTSPSAFTLTASGPVSISGVTGAAAVTNAAVKVGTYTLSESPVTGYSLTGLVCVDASAGQRPVTNNQVALAAGDKVTCTFTNTDVPPQLTLVKAVDHGTTGDTTPADAWTLSAAASGQPTVTGATGTPAVTNAAIRANTAYQLSETGPGGYALTSLVCVSNGQPWPINGNQLTVPPGINVTCTFTNTAQPATLTLVKTVSGVNPDPATSWTLSANGPTPISGTTGTPAVTSVPVQVGSYALSESGPQLGYTASAWTCTANGQSVAVTNGSVPVTVGQSVLCTINNEARPSHLQVFKTVHNTNGGTATADDFTLTATGPTVLNGAGSVSGQVLHGAYTLSESGPAGYAFAGVQCHLVDSLEQVATQNNVLTVNRGDNVVCELINEDQPATLTLEKIVDPGETGSNVAQPSDWTLTAVGASTTVTGPSGDPSVTAVSVPAGSYTLSEDGPAGYEPGFWECTGGVVDGSTVSVPNGGTVICRITNTAITPKLTLVKHVTNDNGGTATPGDFQLTATGPSVISGATGDLAVTNANVEAGQYTVSETGPAGYEWTNLECRTSDGDPVTVDDHEVAIAAGDDITCTLTNDDQPGHLTLIKTVEGPAEAGTLDPATSWTLTADGPSTISGATGEAAITNATVDAGAYDLSESGPSGYTAGQWQCTGGSVDGSTVQVPSGTDVTCTIVNTAIPAQLTLVKEVINDNGGTRDASEWTLAAIGPTAISGVTGTPSVTARQVPAGLYAIGESTVAGYEWTDLTCVTGEGNPVAVGPDTTITLALADHVTCTLTNDDVAGTLQLVKNVAGNEETGGSATADDWHLSAAVGEDVIVAGDGSTPATTVDAGQYVLAETSNDDVVTDGYVAGDWTCAVGDLVLPVAQGMVNVPLGMDVVCSITNTAQPSQWHVAKTANPADGSTVLPGSQITYTITVTHDGGVAPSGLAITDDLSQVLPYADLVGDDPFTTTSGSAQLSGTDVEWTTGTVTDTATLSYSVTVHEDALGVTLRNNVTTGDENHCVDQCTTEHFTPQWTVTKSSDPASGSTVEPGDTITYTLTASNTGPVDVGGVTVSDDLSAVLDKATLDDGSITASTGSASVTDTTLAWTIAVLATGATETVSYTVTVNPDTWDSVLSNVVTGSGPVPPTDCPAPSPERTGVAAVAEPPCGTTHTVPKLPTLRLLKVVDNGDVTRVGTPADWRLIADPVDIVGQNQLTGLGEVPTADVQPGQYQLAEEPATAIAQTGFRAGQWQCVNLVPPQGGEGQPTEEPLEVSEGSVGIDFGDNVLCRIVNVAYSVDLAVEKTSWNPGADGPGDVVADPGKGQTFDYHLAVSNVGDEPATGVVVTDDIPASLTVDESTITAPAGWTVTVTGQAEDGSGGTLTATYAGIVNPGDTAEIVFTVTVGTIAQPDPTVAIPDIENTACVASTEEDSDTTNNCGTDTVPVKSILLTAAAVCRNDIPWLDYSITAVNYDAADFTVQWWNTAVWNNGSPTGAPSAQTPIPLDQLTGSLLWPGVVLDSSGNIIEWPGWRNGGTVEDPTAPGGDLRPSAIVRVISNPSVDTVQVYPPATPQCNPNPPTRTSTPPAAAPTTRLSGTSGFLSTTGAQVSFAGVGGFLLVSAGAAALRAVRRRRRGGEAGL